MSSIGQLLKGGKTKVKIAMQWIAFANKVRPKESFDNLGTPSAPDYDNCKSWAARPDLTDKTSFIPQGIEDVMSEGEYKADVFYVHPTSYFGTKTWNAPIDHPQANEIVDELIMPGQASVFNSSCRIYAPRYRQATFFSFLRGSESSRKAFELAYDDVASAFDHYLQYWNQGRPFIIASHSQGTLHAIRLLEEKIDSSSLREKMIAAYVVGMRIPEDKFEKQYFKNLKVSQTPTDSNCIIAWDTYSENGGPNHWYDKAEHYYCKDGKSWWEPRARKKPISTNPIHWNNNYEKANSDENLGAVRIQLENNPPVRWKAWGGDSLIGIKSTGLSQPHKHEVSARKGEDGSLYISWPKSRIFTVTVMPGGNFHNYDYALFYMNIRKNVKERIDAYLNNNSI